MTEEELDLDPAIAEVLAGWVALLRRGDCRRPRTDQRGVAERNLVRTLLRAAARDPRDEEALRALTLAASRYGALQPMQRLDPGEVTRQFSCLRHEVARRWTAREADHEETLTFLMRVDAALSVATLAVLRGGHAR